MAVVGPYQRTKPKGNVAARRCSPLSPRAWAGRAAGGGGRVMTRYHPLLDQGIDPNDYDDYPVCSICGSGDGDWVDCPQCGGEGGFDDEQLMDDDPMWYQPGDYEKCDMCD